MKTLQRWLSPFSAAYERWSEDGANLLAAAVAYYVALTFFPLLLLLLSALGFFFETTQSGQDAEEQILATIEDQLSPSLRTQVEEVLARVRDKAKVGGPIGLLTLLMAALVIFLQFDAAFDRIWRTPQKKRSLWRGVQYFLFIRLKAFFMLLALGMIVVAVFISSMVLSAVSQLADQAVPLGDWGSWALHLAFSASLNFLVFTLLYKWVPRVRVPWHAAAAGGLLAAVVWEIGRLALSAIVIGQRYSAYGIVGSFLAIMLWAYYATSVIFFGAEFAQTMQRQISPTTPETS
jgi:membrane protein